MMNVLNRIAPLPAQKLLLGISLFFWCGAMHLYWPNNGGSGLSLPLNIMSWMLAHQCWFLANAGASLYPLRVLQSGRSS